MELESDIRYIKGVGEKRALLFNRLGIFSLRDLLFFFPRAYEDWSNISEIRNTRVGQTACVRGIVTFTPEKAVLRKGMTVYKTGVTDGTDVMKITIFNNRFSAMMLEEGKEYLFYGKVGGNFLSREMTNPMVVKSEQGAGIRPVYPQTANLSSRSIEKTVRTALDLSKELLEDSLPEEVRQKYSLCTLAFALENIHFPKSDYDLYCARRRLIFEELLVLQLGMIMLRGRNVRRTGIKLQKDFSEEFYSLLPFTPTKAQKRAVSEALGDMTGSAPMNRLLQGDVGSGKTAVAAALIYNCAKNNIQSALMAPTEILAAQHYETMKKFLENTGIEPVLLTGSATPKQKNLIKEKLRKGEAMLAVGTHALIQKDVEFKNLGFVVTDEQHRFGVAQRGSLRDKGDNPHILVMSATPIPRTLALIIYGDLDVSVLDELPPGRQKTETYAVRGELRTRAMNYVKKHIDMGYQGYIVCPLVEESEFDGDMKSAEQYAKELKNGIFKNYSVDLLHGKMKSGDKDEVMKKFARGETDILVSTTVIEVGVDVPNAVIMVIENAERFGLSQLHQLRGRVGRGDIKSTCILISDAEGEEAKSRLDIMCKTTDGFKIADFDLKLRGPGDFFGSRQHGLPELKIASMLTDTKIMSEAQKTAREITEKDPSLKGIKNKGLLQSVARLFRGVGAEELGLDKMMKNKGTDS